MVVRVPSHNFAERGVGAFPTFPPKLGQVLYSGIDRMPWFDLDEQQTAGTLPVELRAPLQEIRSPSDLTGLCLCRDVGLVRGLLRQSNAAALRNEIVALNGAVLTRVKGVVALGDIEVRSLGFDTVELGHWSLLREGLFSRPHVFPAWGSRLNAHGLLPSASEALLFAQEYRAAMSAGDVEELPDSVYGTDAIEVLRIL
jgi:hypothetical protein